MTIAPEGQPYNVELFSSKAGLPFAARKLSRRLASDKTRFDLVHIHSLWNIVATLSAQAARRAGVPYVLSPRGMLDEVCLDRRRTLKRFYAALFERRTIEGGSLLHFLNDAEAGGSRVTWFNYPPHFIAPNGTNVVAAAVERGAFRRRFPELKDRQLMLFLGRLHPIKGLDLQLQALSKLVPNNPRLLWLLIGPDDGEWQRIHREIQRLGLEGHAQWLGPMMGEERLAALADSDVIVQTSFYECHSMTVGEAMAVGTPLVITDTVNRPEVERAGAGLVVGRDADKVASAVEEILRSPERGELMRAAGRRFAGQHMTWNGIAHEMNAAYREIIYGSPMRGTMEMEPGASINPPSHIRDRETDLLPNQNAVV
jgi:glycosyltransferase involved in cell wall biosynthesis